MDLCTVPCVAAATVPLATRNAAASSRLQSKQTTVGDWRNHTEPLVSSTEPFAAATKRGTKAGFYAEWRWPSETAVDQRARTSSTNLADLSNVAFKGRTSCTGRPRGKGSTAATRELHVTELSIAMLISIFFDNVTTHQQRCVLRASDRPNVFDPSHDPRNPENDEAAPQLVKWSVDATCIRHDL
ncbi:hypothetical protein Q7P36_007477 [Cladosporium allicinum]